MDEDKKKKIKNILKLVKRRAQILNEKDNLSAYATKIKKVKEKYGK